MASQEYDPIHPPNAITDNLPPEKQYVYSIYVLCPCFQRQCPRSLGSVDMGTVEKVEIKVTDEEKERLARMGARPSLSEILNLHDFEVEISPRNRSRVH